MTLEDVLVKIREHTNVGVYSLEGKKIAFYDGKDSIPTELNSIEVFDMYVENNTLNITIYA